MVLYDILRVKSLGTDVYSLDDVNAKLNELVACKGDQCVPPHGPPAHLALATRAC